jgi:hypothetical protein
MRKILVKRFLSNQYKTLGIMHLIDDDVSTIELKTLELPWLNNQKMFSCIPAGKYNAIPINRPHNRGWALHIQNVPNRTAILVHLGNYTSDIQGCILVGINHIDLNNDGITDVSESTRAMSLLKSWVSITKELEIEIIDDFYIGDLDPKTEKKV